MEVTYDKLKSFLTKKYIMFYTTKVKLNIIGIRNNNTVGGKFDDTLVLCSSDDNDKWIKTFQVTVDPSDIALTTMKNSKGTAIVKSNIFYKDLWQLGFHKQDKVHPALVQVNPITVVRDYNKNNNLDIVLSKFDKVVKVGNDNKNITDYYYQGKLVGREETGLFGINCHRASAWRILESVGLYSEGCTVHKDPNRYNKEFIPIIEKYSKLNDKFSYVIINQDEYEKF